MEWLDRFQQKFGKWYQTAFGLNDDTELTPKDVLYKIIDAMEEFRSEGLDGKVYVPNKYIVEISVIHVDERDYLLSLLDEEELTTALERYMAHKNYFTRGPLDFTIEEIAEPMEGEDKLYVRARFEREAAAPKPAQAPVAPSEKASEDRTRMITAAELDLNKIEDAPTIEAVSLDDEDLTVHRQPTAWAALVVASIDGRQSVVTINKPVFTIGRSRHGGNDLIISGDGQVSKRHIRIELEPDHGATLYDLASTNGTFVNGKLVPVNTALRHGDIIEIGQTQLQFQRESELRQPEVPAAQQAVADPPMETVMPEDSETPVPPTRSRQARLTRATGSEEHKIGSEALIGRGLTCDIVLSEPTVSTQQAKLTADTGTDRYFIQDISGRGTTIVNGRPLRTSERLTLRSGDRVSLGGVVFLFTVSD